MDSIFLFVLFQNVLMSRKFLLLTDVVDKHIRSVSKPFGHLQVGMTVNKPPVNHYINNDIICFLNKITDRSVFFYCHCDIHTTQQTAYDWLVFGQKPVSYQSMNKYFFLAGIHMLQEEKTGINEGRHCNIIISRPILYLCKKFIRHNNGIG